MALALTGINVIDVSQGVPGPLCAMSLGDLGAAVTKIEPPDGDWLREIGPFTQGESALFIRLNRNKKGVCVNLKEKAGQEIVRRLARGADILIEGYTSGVMEQLGLSYNSLCKENRGLIYCSISGYGSRGPLANTPDEWRARPISGYTEAPDHGFQCKDAHFLMDWGNRTESWQTLCKALNAEYIATDPRFDEWFKRLNNAAELAKELKPFLANWSFDDLQQLIQGMGGTIVRMNTADTLFNGPQVAALGIVKELDHPVVGKYQTIDVPWLSSEPIAELSPVPAPGLGEHNEEVLQNLGYTAEQIDQLVRAGVIGQPLPVK